MSERRLRVRQAQTIHPFGPGAIIDVQGESFVAAGIENWPAPGKLQTISAPRLAQRLKATGLYSAPSAPVADFDVPDAFGPAFIRFPGWLFCGACRRMTRWRIEMEKFGSPPNCPFCHPKHKLSPMRFVQICADGHLGDVSWWYWAHSMLSPEERESCPDRQRLSFEAGENATGLEALAVRCRNDTCKAARRDLLDILGAQAMRCGGRNPWQRLQDRVNCPQRIQVVQRTAGNVHYAVVHSALDIPTPITPSSINGEIAEKVRNHDFWPMLCQNLNSSNASALIDLIAEVTGADLALMHALIEEETGQVLSSAANPAPSAEASDVVDLSWEEWEAFTGKLTDPIRHFAIREVEFAEGHEHPWTDLSSRITRVIVADRLREVRAFRGFSRLSPDQKFVPVDLTRTRRWLPAVEVFGEGVFLTLEESLLTTWENQDAVRARTAGLAYALDTSFQKDRLAAFTGPNLLPRLPLLHTLGHLLIRQLSFESGYSAASLRERVYARSSSAGEAQYGLLIYTASGDADGTLGGLARQGESDRLAETLLRLLEQAAWCSADPLCSEHTGQGFAGLNLAACHACALVPETSCEVGNVLLDRMLVVGGAGIPGFFELVVEAARKEAAVIADQLGNGR
ncbi:DUF1998 domain-containing protein [Streptosporangium sp. NPDC002524]|uniref:DUF1998 domain-containing protein n=1 Tax=Streptosporangium sp. NPDC002524 TaxID=3154537 RepID=UPI003318E3AA